MDKFSHWDRAEQDYLEARIFWMEDEEDFLVSKVSRTSWTEDEEDYLDSRTSWIEDEDEEEEEES